MTVATRTIKDIHNMYQEGMTPLPRKRRRPSLSLLVTLGLVLAAIIPLAITVAFSVLQTIPALTDQAKQHLQNDAQTRMQLIDRYLQERQLDTQTITQVPSVLQFLAAPPENTPQYQDLTTHAMYSLAAGIYRDKRYVTWALFDAQAQPKLSYPMQAPPKKHGTTYVPQNYLQTIHAGKNLISAVYYAADTQKASVDIYSPIFAAPAQTGTQPTFLGFLRATLNLDYLWDTVQDDQGKNGSGSYAFMLDEHGVRIADTNPTRRFTAISNIPANVQQQLSSEGGYDAGKPVRTVEDSSLSNKLNHINTPETFEFQPNGQSETFQGVRQSSSVAPWNYFVLSPNSTVTQVAYQQIFTTLIIALIASGLVLVIGLIVGSRITSPILHAVDYLRSNSKSLSALANSQRDAASEQMWVVDSSQVGLQSVQYYTEATRIAARQLREIGSELSRSWEHTSAQQAKRALSNIIAAAQYIESAAEYQDSSNQKLSTALRVATQVSEQLSTGATSATDAAAQLEDVVSDLRAVVGK
jgi:methyl-accepting chemotaxis protein